MRNMSFNLTIKQMRDKTKTVTRRLGWDFLKPGDRVMAVEKAQGIKKGELVRIGLIEIISIEMQPLIWLDCRAFLPICNLDKNKPCWGCMEAQKEGFPNLNGEGFMRMFAKKFNINFNDKVNRIEFKHLY